MGHLAVQAEGFLPGRVAVRVLIVGASGLVGSALAGRLAAQGHFVVSVTRSGGKTGLVDAVAVQMDVAAATEAPDWLPILTEVDAVVNCAGVLQDSPGDSTT